MKLQNMGQFLLMEKKYTLAQY